MSIKQPIQKNKNQYLITLSVYSGLFVAGFGFVALLGWFLQLPYLYYTRCKLEHFPVSRRQWQEAVLLTATASCRLKQNARFYPVFSITNFGTGLNAMAPSTAILFVLLGVALFLYNFPATKGIELAATEGPDVILLDIVMPGIDGFDVCRKLKADKKLCDIQEVFVTALEIDKERVKNNKTFTIKLKELRQ